MYTVYIFFSYQVLVLGRSRSRILIISAPEHLSLVQEETKENLRPERVEALPEPEVATELGKEAASGQGSPALSDTSVFSAVDPRSVFFALFIAVLRCRSWWIRNYLRPGAGALMICSQFGGCQDEEKPISTSNCMVLLLQIRQWQYMTGAGAGDGAEKGTKVEPEPKINNFGSATLVYIWYGLVMGTN